MDDEVSFDEGVSVDEKVRLLGRVPLLAGLDEATLTRIAEVAEQEEVAAGVMLTHEGRHEGYFYILVAGTVEIRRGGSVVDSSGPGSFIGEIAMLDAGPRTATAVTLSPCLLLKVSSSGFDALLAADPAVVEALESEMARHLERIDAESGS